MTNKRSEKRGTFGGNDSALRQENSARDADGNTALHLAALAGNLQEVQTLLEGGSDVDAENSLNATALTFAILKNQSAIVRALLTHGAYVHARVRWEKPPITVLMFAAALGSSEIVKELLDSGARVNDTDKNEWTALHYAVGSSNGSLDVFRLLMARGANMKLKARLSTDPSGIEPYFTPLMVAAYLGRVDAVKILLDYGASLNDTDRNNWTPLHYASSDGKIAGTPPL